MGEMIKTNNAICSRCKYATTISKSFGQKYICYYIEKTKKMRNCKVKGGKCDKFEPIKGKRRGKSPILVKKVDRGILHEK